MTDPIEPAPRTIPDDDRARLAAIAGAPVYFSPDGRGVRVQFKHPTYTRDDVFAIVGILIWLNADGVVADSRSGDVTIRWS